MIKPIEHVFRGFGAIQTPYFNITKRNLFGKIVMTMGDIINSYKILKGSVTFFVETSSHDSIY